MRIFLALCTIIMLWSTTPLAIKWSGEGPGFLFGVTARMVIGLACLLPFVLFSRGKLPIDRKAWLTYFSVALQIYGAMLSVYWAAQFIPSGWISVIFGLTPMLTAFMSALLLNERSLGLLQLISYGLGLAGLLVMFGTALDISRDAAMGIGGVTLASFLQSASSVLVKRIGAGLPAVTQVTGGLLVAVPLYMLTWYRGDGVWPASIPIPSLLSVIYLGAIATTIGFALYYYVLTHVPATKVALITLVTPVLSLLIGNAINREPLNEKVLIGAGLVMGALLLHQYSSLFRRKEKNKTAIRRA